MRGQGTRRRPTRKDAFVFYGVIFGVFWVIGALVTWGLYALVVWMQAVDMRARERRRLQSMTALPTPVERAEHESTSGEAVSP